MRACTIVNVCLYVLSNSVIARASPTQASSVVTVADVAPASNAINKRQTGGRRGNEEINNEWPAEWDDLPPLPPKMALAYEKNIQTEMLAIENAVDFQSDGIGGEVWLKSFLRVFSTYLTPERMDEMISEFMQQYRSLLARDVSSRDMLEGRLSELDLSELEEQMAEMVSFRRENEDLGAPGQELWRYPTSRTEDQPLSLYAPFYSLTWLQTRQLIIAKARSGRFNRRQLVDYVQSQDPFMVGSESKTAALVKKALADYKFKPLRPENRRKGFGGRIRDYFRNDTDES